MVAASPVNTPVQRATTEVGRDRAPSTSTITQQRALAHEVLQEEREEAAERRRMELEDKQSHARSRWRKFFSRSSSGQD